MLALVLIKLVDIDMIKKVVKKAKLGSNAAGNDLKYWLSRTPEERISAVEILRRQMHGDNQRLQRVARVIKRKKRSD